MNVSSSRGCPEHERPRVVCAVCDTKTDEWFLVSIQRERACGLGEVEVIGGDDIPYLCVPCGASRRDALRDTVNNFLE